MITKTRNQFSLTRAALSTGGRPKKQFPISFLGAAALMAGTLFLENAFAGVAPNFGSPQIIRTAIPGDQMVMGDFDGDGIPDVAFLGSLYNAANSSNTSAVEVRFGNGANGFRSTASIFTNSVIVGSYTEPGFAAGDLDGDGKSELVFAADNAVLVYGWNGTSFVQTHSIDLTASGIHAYNIAVGNLTARGSQDIIVTDPDGIVGVVWIPNDGKGHFGTPSAFPVSLADASYFPPVLADVNGDGLDDVVLEVGLASPASAAGSTVGVLLNNGHGALSSEVFYGNPTLGALTNLAVRSGRIAVADVDGDGILDLVSACFTEDDTSPFQDAPYLSVNLGNGNGTFKAGQAFRMNTGSGTMAAADLNGDGRIDLVTTSDNYGGFTVTEWSGAGASLAVARQSNFPAGTGWYTSLALGYKTTNGTLVTFNNDAKVDVLLGSAYTLTDTASNQYSQFAVFQGQAGTLGTLPATGVTITGTITPGGPIHFSATQSSTVSGLIVRIQYSTTPTVEGSWTDLPDGNGGHLQLSGAGIYTFGTGGTTYYPRDPKIYFRAITSAPAYRDSISIPFLGPYMLSQPLVAIKGASNFSTVPQSSGATWTFSLAQTSTAAGLSVMVQASPDDVNWTALPSGVMTRSTSKTTYWTLATANIPDGSHYFRALSSAPGFLDTPSPAPWFSNYLASPTALKVATKLPAKSGQQWTFGATLASSAAYLSVRFQATSTPTIESSWSDLPEYTATTLTGSSWVFVTYNIPAGTLFFRAIAHASGWVDGISAPSSTPMTVQASTLVLPAVTGFSITHNAGSTVYAGDLLVFTATNAVVNGALMRFQTKLSSDPLETSWTDLPAGGVLVHVKDKWTLSTVRVPEGARDFRAVAYANGYLDSISATQSLLVNAPRPPQTPTAFSPFVYPADQSVVAAGFPFDVQIGVWDDNGLQTVKLQFATAIKSFADFSGDQMTSPNGDGIYENHNLVFAAPGTYLLRVAAIDNFTPPQTTYSSYITLFVGPGGGTTAPTFGAFANSFVQSTLQARGSVRISVPVFDDKAVYKAILLRLDSNGELAAAVGIMPSATTGNLAVRSLTDPSLSDGVYYYQVLAYDFDGNVSTSIKQGPFILATPLPPPPPIPPPPITITIAPTSRLVNSTHPPSGNHPDMPQPDQGEVIFTWSGLSKGTSTIKIYRSDLDSSRAFFSQTTTLTSGGLTISAPIVDDTAIQGEGVYYIRIFPGAGGDPYPVSTGSVNWFTVGHSWNLTTTFTQLDYGLYWFKDVRNGLRALGVGQNDEYFDPNKPTIIYVHGWQANEVGLRRRESWLRITPDGQKFDLCNIWKTHGGYNVGLFYWNQFAYEDGILWPNEGLFKSEAKIYGTTGNTDSLPAGQGMSYALWDLAKAPLHSVFPFPPLYNEGIVHQSYRFDQDTFAHTNICDLFYNEMVRCLTGYDTNKNELRIIGHSLGTQVIGRTMQLICDRQPYEVPLPTRIALLDLAETWTTTLPRPYFGKTVPELQKAYLDNLASLGVAIESYQSTDLQSFMGIPGAVVKPVFDLTAYERIRPDWILPLSLSDSHGEAIRWYSMSFALPEPAAWSYNDWLDPLRFWPQQRVGSAISARSTTETIRSLMGGELYFNQTIGKMTSVVSDDGFEQVYNRNRPY